MGVTITTDSLFDVKDAAVLGGRNLVANPDLQLNTNFWTASSVTTTLTGSGLALVGSGEFYQTLNTATVADGTLYMARCYVNTASGTWKMMVGNTTAASDMGSVTLTTGWNSFRFTASTANIIMFYSSSQASTDTLVVSPAEVREQKDLCVTGQLETGEILFGSGSNPWRFAASGTDLVAQRYESGAWVSKGAFSA